MGVQLAALSLYPDKPASRLSSSLHIDDKEFGSGILLSSLSVDACTFLENTKGQCYSRTAA
jgi:hypothetical protein